MNLLKHHMLKTMRYQLIIAIICLFFVSTSLAAPKKKDKKRIVPAEPIESSSSSRNYREDAETAIETGIDYALENDFIPLPAKMAFGAGKALEK